MDRYSACAPYVGEGSTVSYRMALLSLEPTADVAIYVVGGWLGESLISRSRMPETPRLDCLVILDFFPEGMRLESTWVTILYHCFPSVGLECHSSPAASGPALAGRAVHVVLPIRLAATPRCRPSRRSGLVQSDYNVQSVLVLLFPDTSRSDVTAKDGSVKASNGRTVTLR